MKKEDFIQIKNHDDYLNYWKNLPQLKITCVEKNEECKHNVGDSFIFKNPYTKPEGVCTALLHVLDLYTWRSTLGFPSWNSEDRSKFKLHCPDPKGTIWEMEAIEKE
ncbi:MAG: hypothetical protein A2015_04150 [Spirochaetes bacterium GWF1_31_7]|nr:MAG: hypothetical protein A2Y30_17120 [Spirochaetes bacterium GWE1_32_154]OHD47417.1 MAG: hypothetical protein A2Y29_10130 [Spirochaetes bacterium GWE2_31_10]OHD52916.1 MAG: hypothetical protein A2015_04150 [Spirochaetes bacterium GWF1_31_7]HBD95039.1 hypothetical protein [Spirochaetia bacterium]HBI37159.1 hypothetical protein [Spirochaetia bacterium]